MHAVIGSRESMPVQHRRTLIWSRKQHERGVRANGHRDLEHELGPAVLDACRCIWREFVELSSLDPQSFADDEQELLRWYAELQFRLGTGGGHCDECGAHVRHALPMRAEIGDSVRDYHCLCTRCLVAVEHEADRIWYTVAGRHIEHPIRSRTQMQAA